MTSSKIPEFVAIILIIIVIISGYVMFTQPHYSYDNSTYFVTSNDSTISLAGKYIVKNDTYWISIDPISNYYTYYSRFNITTKTNLPIDENISIRIYATTDRAKDFGSISLTGSAKVTAGGSSFNKTSFWINQKTLGAGDYIVLISAGEKGPSNFTPFKIGITTWVD